MCALTEQAAMARRSTHLRSTTRLKLWLPRVAASSSFPREHIFVSPSIFEAKSISIFHEVAQSWLRTHQSRAKRLAITAARTMPPNRMNHGMLFRTTATVTGAIHYLWEKQLRTSPSLAQERRVGKEGGSRGSP